MVAWRLKQPRVSIGDNIMPREPSPRTHDITTGRSFTLRLTDNEKKALGKLVKKVQKEFPRKQVTMSLILRGVTYLEGEEAIQAFAKGIRLM